MKVNLFDFNLPEKNIALRPLPNREDAKLLYVNDKGDLSDYKVSDLIDLLQPGDILCLTIQRYCRPILRL